MPAEVFVDTSAWYPLLVRTHADHRRLAGQLRRLVAAGRRVVTTNLVVAETHALTMRRAGVEPALAFVHTVSEPPNLVVRSSEELERRAVHEWLERFRDQDLSFTDAVSFAVMTERKITHALTLDRHFVVAGFTALGGG